MSVLQPFDDLKYSFLAVLLFTKIPAKVRKNLETQKSKTNIPEERIFKNLLIKIIGNIYK
ncbi:hypothetical protein CGC54_02535 [Capnocytophaga canimorsus]|uniref:Uncharacterized protein n=1 Tax=Capnocytophaga canimorsus TaxID=28188 RepID=A0AAD0E9T0_9FLAO|nr:hypothetical protein CGC54_02535 [Capnocytophaga canimorsus]